MTPQQLAAQKYKLHNFTKTILADTTTPVNLYLKLRDQFPNSFLLESSDYHSNENSFSYLCFQPIASLIIQDAEARIKFPNGAKTRFSIDATDKTLVPAVVDAFAAAFFPTDAVPPIHNGLFGYIAYNAVRYFENIGIDASPADVNAVPDVQYHVFRYVVAINHFKNEMYLLENQYDESDTPKSTLPEIEDLIQNRAFPTYHFQRQGEESSNFTDEAFLKILEKGKAHIHRGDVFQLVLSRRFEQQFLGDEFNVYRALRSINPSPYLFYFDYGDFKLFGSSPEAQIVVKDRKAYIYPIAGTFRRTGDDMADVALAEQLQSDRKENAEHVMLVDLARNDLSRHGENVTVETFKEIQYYSHVIHLVSKVTADLNAQAGPMPVVADTFPAGTLSGAPKHRAMELINQYEKGQRSYYGGCIGFRSFSGHFNHAIMIRSFLSKHNTLFYQAGAGVVAASKIESELQEVNNKLLALKRAIKMAEKI